MSFSERRRKSGQKVPAFKALEQQLINKPLNLYIKSLKRKEIEQLYNELDKMKIYKIAKLINIIPITNNKNREIVKIEFKGTNEFPIYKYFYKSEGKSRGDPTIQGYWFPLENSLDLNNPLTKKDTLPKAAEQSIINHNTEIVNNLGNIIGNLNQKSLIKYGRFITEESSIISKILKEWNKQEGSQNNNNNRSKHRIRGRSMSRCTSRLRSKGRSKCRSKGRSKGRN